MRLRAYTHTPGIQTRLNCYKMFALRLLAVVIASAVGTNLFAQHAVDPSASYYRLICLVHLTGSGKGADTVRPEYAPIGSRARTDIIAWSFQLTDDKQMAIVHLVALDRNAFQAIFADKRPEVKVFEIGKDSRAAIEKEMQKHKKDFNLDNFKVLAR